MGNILATPVRHDPVLGGTWKNLTNPPERSEYIYFQRAKALPFLSGSTYVKAAWAADAAMLACGRFGTSVMPAADLEGFLHTGAGLEGVQRIGNWARPGTQGYFAFNNQFAILSFRGTDATDPLDSLADLDGLLVDEHVVSHCQVHQGFQRALDEVWEQVRSVVSTFRGSHAEAEICFTGHSLGAALATIAFSRINDAKASLYTFGGPRVGNSAFCARCEDRVFRFVNGNDPVAHVPVADDRYQHVPQACIRIDDKGNLVTDDGSFQGDVNSLRLAVAALPKAGFVLFPNTPAPEGLVDHSPARYCVRLWNCV